MIFLQDGWIKGGWYQVTWMPYPDVKDERRNKINATRGHLIKVDEFSFVLNIGRSAFYIPFALISKIEKIQLNNNREVQIVEERFYQDIESIKIPLDQIKEEPRPF